MTFQLKIVLQFSLLILMYRYSRALQFNKLGPDISEAL